MDVVTGQQAATGWGPYFFTALFVSAFAMYVTMTVLHTFTRPRGKLKR